MLFHLCPRHLLPGLKTPATAAVIQTAPPVTHLQTAATPPARLQRTATAAVTAMMTARPPPLPPPPLRPQTAQTQGAAVIQIKDPQGRRKRRNKYICWNKWVSSLLFISFSNFSNPLFFFFISPKPHSRINVGQHC